MERLGKKDVYKRQGEHGKVDLPYMAKLLGTPGEYGRITTEPVSYTHLDVYKRQGQHRRVPCAPCKTD